MIIDMIAELGYSCWTKKNIKEYVVEWIGDIDAPIIDKIFTSLLTGNENYKMFKEGCMEYMEAYGYKGCAIYNRFKRMPLKEIKQKLSV